MRNNNLKYSYLKKTNKNVNWFIYLKKTKHEF